MKVHNLKNLSFGWRVMQHVCEIISKTKPKKPFNGSTKDSKETSGEDSHASWKYFNFISNFCYALALDSLVNGVSVVIGFLIDVNNAKKFL